MKSTTAIFIVICAYSSVVGAVERCDAIAFSLIRAAMITPENSYDFRSVKEQLISSCEIGSAAAEKGENINQAIIDNLNYQIKMANKITEEKRAALKLADLAFQLGFDTYNQK